MSDATPAYRGYRLQALYTLYRVLTSGAGARVFGPEGGEDLAVFVDGRRTEINQVKAYKDNLGLSDLEPEKEASFLRRAVALLRGDPAIRISLVSFGPLGPELDRALAGAGPNRDRIIAKLVSHGFSSSDAAMLLGSLRGERVREEQLRSRVLEALGRALTGVDPERAFDLLTHWLYICSEERRRITRQDLIDWVNGVGRFLAERAAHHAEWFTTIVPIEDRAVDGPRRESLSREFYQGVAVRYEHVMADLDVMRPTRLREIADAFEVSHVVILHAASGQGKTTLAYRYLREAFPDAWRFEVRLVESPAHALGIAVALLGHAHALEVPITILLDVRPSDSNWPELVRQLATDPSVRVLVAVREEDWRRAAVAQFEVPFTEVALSFDRAEAEELYGSLADRELPTTFLDFEDAWGRFGSQGPLLEFVHLVTQGEALRDRLRQQVQRLDEHIIAGKWSEPGQSLLRLVSVASAFGARLKAAPLVERLGVPAPRRSVELLEEEYFVRRTEDGVLLEGLHPVRSALLAELLTDDAFTPWVDSAAACLDVMDERDVGTFLLYAFSRNRGHLGRLLEALTSYYPTRWTAIAGVARALIWLGLREYVEINRPLIGELAGEVGNGWWTVLDADIADAVPGSSQATWAETAGRIPEVRRRRLEDLRTLQTDKRHVFARAMRWLEGYPRAPEVPSTTEEWSSAAEAIFWAGRLGVAWPCVEWLTTDVLNGAALNQPLDTIADLVVSLEQGYGSGFGGWLAELRPVLADRFQRLTRTPMLEDDGFRLTAHFIVDPVLSEEPSPFEDLPLIDTRNRLHNEAMLRIDLLRRLFPDRESFACQGYGHRPWSFPLEYDETRKAGVHRSQLPLRRLTRINSTFRGLAEYPVRPSDWREFALAVTVLREEATRSLGDLAKALPAFLRSPTPMPILGKSIQEPVWERRWRLLREQPLLPKSAVDEWGLIDEAMVGAAAQLQRRNIPVLLFESAEMDRMRSLLDGLGRYAWSLQNFHLQATEVIRGTRRMTPQRSGNVGQPNRDYRRVSISNLADAGKAIPALRESCHRTLGHLLDDHRIVELDQREAERFAVVWPLWYAFVNEPDRVLPDPVRMTAERFDAMIERLRRNVRRELELLTNGMLRVRMASEHALWEGEPALWITIDGDDAAEVYGALENVIDAVRRGYQAVEASDLRRDVVDFRWRYVVVLPLVHGRSVTTTAWRFLATTLVDVDAIEHLEPWSFVPLPVPDEALGRLGVAKWQHPKLDPAAQLVEVAGTLWLLASHVHDLRGLSTKEGVKAEIVLDHADEARRRAITSLRHLLEIVDVIAGLIGALSPPQRQRRVHITYVEEEIGMIRKIAAANLDQTGSDADRFLALIEWAESMRELAATATSLRLHWTTDVLGANSAEM